MTFQRFKVKGGKVKGKGVDENGAFKIKGKVHEDGDVTFKKDYNGKSYKVEYMGRLEGGKIHG